MDTIALLILFKHQNNPYAGLQVISNSLRERKQKITARFPAAPINNFSFNFYDI